MSNKLKHILVIDDDDDIRAVVQLSLEIENKYTVTLLTNGEDAVSKAPHIKPDIILLDVMMPKMDGPSTLKKLRQDSNLDDVPIILMTARVQTSEIEEYLKIGAAGVIPKPFDPMNLCNQVNEMWQEFKKEK